MDEDGEGVAWTTNTWSSVEWLGRHGVWRAWTKKRGGHEQQGVEQSGVDDEALQGRGRRTTWRAWDDVEGMAWTKTWSRVAWTKTWRAWRERH